MAATRLAAISSAPLSFCFSMTGYSRRMNSESQFRRPFLGVTKMNEQFQLGDVVQLKSGGPRMTVDEIGPDMTNRLTVWCTWFDGLKKVTDNFPASSVILKP
jgi:uncharacterized protein YodC (DUF2158 family)